MAASATVGVAIYLVSAVGALATAGCDPPRARPAQVPAAAAQSARFEYACLCDGEDDRDDDGEPDQWLASERPRPVSPVEYVKMSEWTPPPSVKELEAVVPPRGDAPPDYIRFPRLTKHSSIGNGAMHLRRH
ncbi:MAG: hypothetical protein JWO86_748 [Myxococcaceae bacterium]|nr:hypothetical protein [Myxococcaceae bacterium]